MRKLLYIILCLLPVIVKAQTPYPLNYAEVQIGTPTGSQAGNLRVKGTTILTATPTLLSSGTQILLVRDSVTGLVKSIRTSLFASDVNVIHNLPVGTSEAKSFNLSGQNSIAQGGDFSIYGTADQVTNYERLRLSYDATNSIFNLNTENGGTGLKRSLRIGILNKGMFVNTDITSAFTPFQINNIATNQLTSVAGLSITAKNSFSSTVPGANATINSLTINSYVGATNTQNWPYFNSSHHPNVKGILVATGSDAGSSGSIPLIAGAYVTIAASGVGTHATFEEADLYHGTFQHDGVYNRAVGIRLDDLDAGTTSGIGMWVTNGDTHVAPDGFHNLFFDTGYNNVLGSGATLINTATDNLVDKLQVVGTIVSSGSKVSNAKATYLPLEYYPKQRVDSLIAAIPAPTTPTLQSVLTAGNSSTLGAIIPYLNLVSLTSPPSNPVSGQDVFVLNRRFTYMDSVGKYRQIYSNASGNASYKLPYVGTGTIPDSAQVSGLLATKEPSVTTGTTAQYYRGDKTFQTLNTTAVPEGTNQYFTQARVLATTLTGYTTGSNTPITSSNMLLTAFQNIQAQITANSNSFANYVPTSRTITNGVGLLPSGAQDLSANRTNSVDTAGTIASKTYLAGFTNTKAQSDAKYFIIAGNNTPTGVNTFSPTISGAGTGNTFNLNTTLTGNNQSVATFTVNSPVVNNSGGYTGGSTNAIQANGAINSTSTMSGTVGNFTTSVNSASVGGISGSLLLQTNQGRFLFNNNTANNTVFQLGNVSTVSDGSRFQIVDIMPAANGSASGIGMTGFTLRPALNNDKLIAIKANPTYETGSTAIGSLPTPTYSGTGTANGSNIVVVASGGTTPAKFTVSYSIGGTSFSSISLLSGGTGYASGNVVTVTQAGITATYTLVAGNIGLTGISNISFQANADINLNYTLSTAINTTQVLVKDPTSGNIQKVDLGSIGGVEAVSLTPITANYTITANDRNLLLDATAGNITITITPSTLLYAAGRTISLNLKRVDVSANTITVTTTSGFIDQSGTTSITIAGNTNKNLKTNGTGTNIYNF